MPVNLPNVFTIARILLVPVTIWLLIAEAYGLAFISFITAGVSDAVDGALARRYNLVSELGAYLDPLADKALLVSIYVTLALLQILPVWLAIVVVTRDIMIVGAVLLARFMNQPVDVKPLWISKVNTTAQIAFAGLLLGALAFSLDLALLVPPGIVVVAATTTASGALYLRGWLRHMST